MRLVRMSPGHGDVVLAEGDPKLSEDHERLIAEFRHQLELGMWAAVPIETKDGHREATFVRYFDEIPEGTEQVIFFPQAAGGSEEWHSGQRVETRARELLRSAAGPDNAALYDELGFLAFDVAGADYGYLIYAHRPLVAWDKRSGEPLGEYCVRFLDSDEALPDADDVLAKWMALSADERGLLADSNVHPLGRQLDPKRIRRDLRLLAWWRDRNAVSAA